MRARRPARGALLIALSAAGYGVMPVLIRMAYDDGARPFGLLSVRFIAAFLVMLIALTAGGALRGVRIGRRSFGKLLLLGGVFFAGTSITLYLSVGLLAPSVAELIYFSYPGFVLLIAAIFLKERIGAAKVAGLLVMLAGVALTVAGPFIMGMLHREGAPAAIHAAGFADKAGGANGMGGSNAIGAGLAVLCALVYSLYVTFIHDRDVEAAGPALISLFVAGCCAVIFTVAMMATGEGLPHLGMRGTLALAGIVVFSTVLPIFLFAAGSRELPASEVAMIACLEPAVTVLADILALGRRFDPATASGLVFIGAGLVALTFLRKGREA